MTDLAGVSRVSWLAAEVRAAAAVATTVAAESVEVVVNRFRGEPKTETSRETGLSFDLRKFARIGPAMQQGESRHCIAYALTAIIEGRAAYLDTARLGLPDDVPVDLDEEAFLDEVGESTSVQKHNRVAEASGVPDAAGTFRLRPRLVSQRGVKRMQRALRDMGPLLAIMHLYANFRDFSGPGLYVPSGDRLGRGHAVCIIGYEGTGETGSWIIKNSYGTSWGADDGYFRVAFGERNLDLENATFAVRELVRC